MLDFLGCSHFEVNIAYFTNKHSAKFSSCECFSSTYSLSLLKGADGWLVLNHMAYFFRVYHLASV